VVSIHENEGGTQGMRVTDRSQVTEREGKMVRRRGEKGGSMRRDGGKKHGW